MAKTAINDLRIMKTEHGTVEEYRDKAGQFRWRCITKNGRIVCDSGEGYTRKHSMRRGLTAARNIMKKLPLKYIK